VTLHWKWLACAVKVYSFNIGSQVNRLRFSPKSNVENGAGSNLRWEKRRRPADTKTDTKRVKKSKICEKRISLIPQ
jgi:hypothetical protein